jgi:hypothetical protein
MTQTSLDTTSAPLDPTGATPLPGQPDPDVEYESYWGVDITERFYLKDGKQYFEVKPMDEGAKSRFQRKTNRGMRFQQRTQEAMLDVDPAGDRHQLIKDSVVGWFLMEPVPGQPGEFAEFIYPGTQNSGRLAQAFDKIFEKFNPKVIQDLEFFIRLQNPWMQAEMDVDEIDEEIRRLETMRKQVIEEKAGEGSSANR